MPPEQPLLTIAIPTYNRSAYLAQLLSALAPQLKDEPRVELIISDNASPDDTPALVQQFIENGLKVRYIRNETNIGPDRNFIQCFEEAAGRYVWMIGDDDVVLEGGLQAVLSCCEESPAIIHVAARGFHGEFNQERFAPVLKVRQKVLLHRASFARALNIMATFISGVIVSKEQYLRTRQAPLEDFLGTNLVQLAWTFPLIARGTRFVHIKTTLVASRSEFPSGYQAARVFGSNFRTVAEQLLGSSPALVRIFENAMILRFFPAFLLRTRTGKHTSQQDGSAAILRGLYRSNMRFWLAVYPILAWNRNLARPFCFGVRIMNRVDRALGSPLL